MPLSPDDNMCHACPQGMQRQTASASPRVRLESQFGVIPVKWAASDICPSSGIEEYLPRAVLDDVVARIVFFLSL